MDTDISISSVVTASLCPLRYYLDQHDVKAPSTRYEVCKQVSYHVRDQLDGSDIWNELRAVQPEIDESFREYLHHCLARCRKSQDFGDFLETDFGVRSGRHGIFGVVDKILDRDLSFSIVRPVPAPRAGIYSADRLRVFGYAICLQEMAGEKMPEGFVEYIPDGVCRPCIPQAIDKRRFFRALDQARKIRMGEIPKKPVSPPCESCQVRDRCTPGGTRLSDLMK